jgi:PAB1-binding protein PBP1
MLTSETGASSGFRTDTDISGNAAFRERNLQRWEPAADTEVDHSLESTGGAAGWDQFSTNEQLFGVKSDYDESIYTTTINRNDPKYAERVARADMLAREIEASSALNAHIREERGVTSPEDKDMDEEAK